MEPGTCSVRLDIFAFKNPRVQGIEDFMSNLEEGVKAVKHEAETCGAHLKHGRSTESLAVSDGSLAAYHEVLLTKQRPLG